jgi:4-O-beta-D-mannosyl-D-glucose phosphorylase
MIFSPTYAARLKALIAAHQSVVRRRNVVDSTWNNGWFERFRDPVVTPEHTPLFWRYDLNPTTNPRLLERLGVNVTFNAGAIEMGGKVCVMVRVEGFDRKSFFAVAESTNGVDGFRFRDYPIVMPQTDDPDVNAYDMRLTKHADGWIYGLFCTERKDPKAAPGDESSAVAACGIARTRDLERWERLPDLASDSPQQRNVVLHPEFVDGKYALYTRPQDDFIKAGSRGGIAWALTNSMERAVVHDERIIEPKVYHTLKEVKNGMGAPPIKTAQGWLHVGHGVRNTAAGLRYVLYSFLCDLHDPSRVLRRPGGYFIAPRGPERVGDVSNVVFSNGMVARPDGELLIYYASSDTLLHVARTSVDTMLDYVTNTPEDPLFSHRSVAQRRALIDRNLTYLQGQPALAKTLRGDAGSSPRTAKAAPRKRSRK